MDSFGSEMSYRAARGGGRIPMVPVALRGGIANIHVPSSSRVGIGCITSRRTPELDFWEVAALKAGCTVEEVKRRAQA
jgi:hypothetical protein